MSPGRLQRELKKKHSFESPEQEAHLNLVRTADRLGIAFVRLFRRHAVTPSQYNILRILRGAGEALPILEIAERTVTVVPGITGLVDRLEQAALVRRERSESDRRVIYVALTEAGKKVLAGLDEPVRRLHVDLLGHMSPGELRRLNDLLEKARAGAPPAEE